MKKFIILLLPLLLALHIRGQNKYGNIWLSGNNGKITIE
ncbi:MAG: hypothetical protein RLZZ118_1391 [Bacteroidota bacterium]|jgi:hypothetical protein